MNDYDEGDRVRAEKDSTVIEGTLWGCEELFVGLSRRTVAHLLTDGFTITVIEKAAPVVVLPTEPGLYTTDIKDLPTSLPLYRLNENGEWSTIWAHIGEQTRAPAEILDGIKPGILTRLEPVSETAKKVLDRVADMWEFGMPAIRAIELSDIAKEFGAEL